MSRRLAMRRPPAWLGLLFHVFAALLLAGAARAQDVAVPALSGRVIDQTSTLGAEQLAALTGKLAAIETETGTQIVVLMVPTTLPEDIASYSQRVGEQWKIGRRGVGDGLLIVVAKEDRKVRIEVAKTLEGAIPDLAARRIITEFVTPAFRAGDYAGGLNNAVDKLAGLVRGEALPPPSQTTSPTARPGMQLEELAIFFFVAVPLIGSVLKRVFGRKLGSLLTGGAAGGIGWWLTASALIAAGAGFVALLLVGLFGLGGGGRRGLGNMPIIWGGGGGGGGGFGGGGFSSGGGGDFGGGGASGDW